jgi:hypothetical protein
MRTELIYPCPPGFNGRLAGLYRFISGRPLNGHRYTDATFFRAGTMATDISGKANRYQLLAGWQRLAIRVAKSWSFRRQVIEPLAISVATVTKSPHAVGHGRAIHSRVTMARDFRDNPEGVLATIHLPKGWLADKGDMARLNDVVARQLQVDELVATWKAHGHKPTVEYRMPVQPPASVTFAEMKDVDSPDPILGVGAASHVEVFSLELESPHLLIGGGTGAGKSVLMAWLVGQFMRMGYGVLAFDSKFISHMWLRRIPGVHYAAETEELHEGLLWLDRELLRRARFVASGGNPDELAPLVAVLEEMNGATNRLRSYWKNDLGGQGMSPALTALGNLSSMGRELRLHILMAGQSMTSKATAGVENRENFGARALARATANQWKMLAPQIRPAPLKRRAPGRWHLVVGDTLKEFQVPFVNLKDPVMVAELIEWATAGAPILDVPAMMAGLMTTIYANEDSPWSGSKSSVLGVGLSDYVMDRPGLTLTQLQNWRQRFAEAFPEAIGTRGRATLYAPADLDAFVASRLREPADPG